METKICCKCKETKNLKLFSRNKNKTDGYHNQCKLCIKELYILNKDKRQKYFQEWRSNNRNKHLEYNRIYYKNNINSQKSRTRVYKKKRKNTDVVFKLTENSRNLIYNSIKNKGYSKKSKTYQILGCTFEEFKNYLESKFEPWMSWENYGKYNGEFNFGWDIDHIIPMSSAKSEEEVINLNHYTNLQPLCSYINRVVKRDKNQNYEI